ncbi:MAG: HmuY family protein [Bacteroidaceae bacterium]|nr:HmuY family protein [Bacteroidaceae bacterium]
MNKKIIYIALSVLLSVTLISCRDRKEQEHEPVPVKHELTLTLEPGKWIYYSFTDSMVVGRSDIGDVEQDQEWAAQTNWDIALSESGIRTNSGTSGRGNGGLAIITDSIYNLQKFSSVLNLNYKPDTLSVIVTKPLNE